MPVDARMVPDGASLVGEHAFSGTGVPEGFRFQIAAAQDLMPPLQLQQADQAGARRCSGTRCPRRAPTSSPAWARHARTRW